MIIHHMTTNVLRLHYFSRVFTPDHITSMHLLRILLFTCAQTGTYSSQCTKVRLQLLYVSSRVHKANPCTGMERSESFDNVK